MLNLMQVMKIDETKIENFLNRGVENVFPNKKDIKSKIIEGKPLKMYLGIDPTGPSLHIGHLAPLLKLKEFQEMGHKTILLVGDFTATIGDPTGKDKARKPLTKEEVLKNSEKYKDQASNILSFDGENATEIKFNSEWLSGLNFEEILKHLSNLTVDQMLKRDMFQKRQKDGNPIFLHEFLYPFMQGMDSVFMDTDGEVGGNDQTFNMLVGRDLLKSIKNKEKFVVATKLLTDSKGEKMGKTEGNMVSFDQKPEEIYGGIMSFGDDLIIPSLELLTTLDKEDIKKYQKQIEEGENPRNVKFILAKQITKLIHGEDAANQAEESFKKTFSEKGLPENPTEIQLKNQEALSDVLVRENLIQSKSEFKRLVEQGGVREVQTNKVVEDFNYIPEKGEIFKIGKKQFIKIS